MKDVSETVNLCESEPTVACGEIEEGFIVQITGTQVRCCSLLDLQGRLSPSWKAELC